MAPPSARPFGALLLLVTLACFSLQPAYALLAPPTRATLVHTNSTSLSFSVDLPADTTALQLRVVVIPASDNATMQMLDLQASPMLIELTKLRPGSSYTLRFSLVDPSSVNGSDESTPLETPSYPTYTLGPQIVSFEARDPTPSGDDLDKGFSAGDQVVLGFDTPTNAPALPSAEEMAKYFAFSQPIGAAYHGEWNEEGTILTITIDDKGVTDSQIGLGTLMCSIIGDIRNRDGGSEMSRSVSPPLIGSWTGATAGSPRYFSGTANIRSLVNEDVKFPLRLSFPASVPPTSTNYHLGAVVVYPAGSGTPGFTIQGQQIMSGNNSFAVGTMDRGNRKVSAEALMAALPTWTLTPNANYAGYVSIKVTLYDFSKGSYYTDATMSTFFTVLIAPLPPPAIPELTVARGEASLLSNPISAIKNHKTGLIVGLCVVFGFFLILGLSICLYKKYRFHRDARDFEGHGLTAMEDEPRHSEGGPTRRFYYDAKV